MANDPNNANGAGRWQDLQAMLDKPGIKGDIRRAMHKRLQDLGITEPKCSANLLGNAITPLDFPLDYLHEGAMPPEQVTERFRKLKETAVETRLKNLGREPVRGKAPEARLPSGAAEYYQQASQSPEPFKQPPFRNGAEEISVSNLFQILVSDLRITAIDAVMESLVKHGTATGQPVMR